MVYLSNSDARNNFHKDEIEDKKINAKIAAKFLK